jgi:glyoxylase-like metal-dependent hydrolase (beta-lactamase superfamily II)
MKELSLGALILSVATLGIAAQQPPARTGTLAERGLTAANFPQNTQLADNVYIWSDVHPSGVHTTNDLIVVTTDGVLVADGQKDTATSKKMVDFIKGLTAQPIRYVVVASEHTDHTGGNEAFPSTAVFISSRDSQANLAAQAKGDRPGGPRTIVPTETVDDRRVLKMGATEIQIVNNGRAHTGGDIEVYLPAEKIFFVSEAFSFHIFPNSRAAVPTEWIATVKKIQQVDFRIIVPGHGYFDDQTVMRDELSNFVKLMEFTVTEATRAHGAGLTAAAAARQINWGSYAEWPLFADRAEVALQRTYDELDGKLK